MTTKIGIDLGTSFSSAAIVDSTGKPVIIPNSYGNKITPSVIQFDDENVVVGEDAYEAFKIGDSGCVAAFKRYMGKDDPCFYTDDNEYTAQDLSTILLAHLKQEIENELGRPIDEVVITVPAYFFSEEREATINAAEKAGLKVKKLIDEPNAAALAYGLNHWRENANILVYDLGGGTFDVTLVRMNGVGELKTISTKGNHILGGKDWDERLTSLLLDKFSTLTDSNIKYDDELKAIVRGKSEEAKKKLSSLNVTKVTVNIPNFGKESVEVTKAEFEEISRDLLEETGRLCRFVLGDCNLQINDITDVLLVGGSSRMPQISEYIESLFGKKPITHINADEAVALGAAIQATKPEMSYIKLSKLELEDGTKVTDVLAVIGNLKGNVQLATKLMDIGKLHLRETTAHAMGIIAIDDEENCYYNEVIIPANHPRPVRSAKRFRFFTSENLCNELEIYVLQGDNKNPLDCKINKKYVVSGIQHNKKDEKSGTLIRVQYSYDNNGIIQIQARQGLDDADLPIQKSDTPDDISKFGKPLKQGQTDSASSGLQLMRAVNQSVVHKYKEVTFSNVEWTKYDNIKVHAVAPSQYKEPLVHVIANQKAIEFHGYNVSAMDEGVFLTLSSNDDFEIVCDINTSDIKPHPGGSLLIKLGIITARLTEKGGNLLLDGEVVAAVGAKFKLKMSVSDGKKYEVYTDNKLAGSKEKPVAQDIDVRFGFIHSSHHCHIISQAYISNIEMKQRGSQDSGSSDTDTWDD